MNNRPVSGCLITLSIGRVLARLVGLSLVVVAAGRSLYGQSCAMCYTTVAGGGKGVIHALQGGIIVLLIPPLLFFSAFAVLLFRWKTKYVFEGKESVR